MRALAISTRSQAQGSLSRSNRNASRKSRFARLRSTALRNVRLLAITPQRLTKPAAGNARNTIVRPTRLCASEKRRSKSFPRRKRDSAPKVAHFMLADDAVTATLHRSQTCPALAATTRQNLTTILCGHPRTETDFTRTLFCGRLICPFHDFSSFHT